MANNRRVGMFPEWVSEIGTILVQAFMITAAGWVFVFTCWDIQEMKKEEEDEQIY